MGKIDDVIMVQDLGSSSLVKLKMQQLEKTLKMDQRMHKQKVHGLLFSTVSTFFHLANDGLVHFMLA